MINNEMLQELERAQAAVEERLGAYFAEDASYGRLLEAMRYSLLAGGKRIRAILCIKFCEASGGTLKDAIGAACAIEMLHAYSLIHDDLPCMDDAETRRGKPSNHIKYGEFTATLAGDALQAAAFETLVNSSVYDHKAAEFVRIFAEAAGPNGICGGQYLDLQGEGRLLTIDELLEIHSLKTSALISAAARIGVVAGGGDPRQVEAAGAFAQAVGLAFQIRDDILDCTATQEELGKPTGSDSANEKATFVTLLGVEDSEAVIRKETSKAIAALEGKFEKTGFLRWFAGYLAQRKS